MSACSLRSWSWFSMKASMPPVVALRVVSLPATTMMRHHASLSMRLQGLAFVLEAG